MNSDRNICFFASNGFNLPVSWLTNKGNQIFSYRSEANDLAIRLARHYTRGTEMITLDQ